MLFGKNSIAAFCCLERGIRELGVRQFKRSGTIQLSAVQGLSTFLGEYAPIPKTDPEAIKLRIDGLFTQVPKQSWMKLYRTIQECLEAAREDLGLEDLKDLFKTTKDEIHFSPTTFRNVANWNVVDVQTSSEDVRAGHRVRTEEALLAM